MIQKLYNCAKITEVVHRAIYGTKECPKKLSWRNFVNRQAVAKRSCIAGFFVLAFAAIGFNANAGSSKNDVDVSAEDYVEFWAKEAEKLDWFKKWTVAEEKGFPFVRWFKEGKLNACYNCLDRHVLAGKGDKVAFYWENERGAKRVWTYKDIYVETQKLANVYKSLGLKKGDRVSIYMPMVPESIVAMLAATRIGLVHNFIFGGIGGGSVKERINDSESVLLVTADGGLRRGKTINYKKTVDEILVDCPTIKHTIVLKYNGEAISMKPERDVWYHDAIGKADETCPCEPMDSEDMMFLLYTSGTTGKPKGLMHTTGGYLVGVNSTHRRVFDVKPTDIYWCTADPGWITGHSFGVYGPMCNGMTQFMYEGALDYPNQDQFAKFIERYKITTFYTAPTFISMLMKWGEKNCINSHDLSSLRLLGSIGEPLKPEVWEWYNRCVGNSKCPIVDTWFQTETGAFVISPIPGVTKLKPGSVTMALPGYTVDILNEAGDSVKRGLLAIKKPFPSMMRGIYKDNDRYLKTYWCKWGGKYYYAGDNASKDEDGYIYVSGRADEVLKVSGHRIGTAEIEAAIMDDQRVAEVAAIGIDDAVRGTNIAAFVVLKGQLLSNETIEKELKLLVQKNLGSYARPEHVIFVPQVPKNRSGKVLRRILKCAFEGKDHGNTETLVNPSAVDEVTQAIKQYKNKSSEKSFLKSKYFSKITTKTRMSAKEIANIVQPILSNHLVENVYNRLYPVVQFLDFFEKKREHNSELSPLFALKEFDTKSIVFSDQHNGSCFTLINNFVKNIPTYLSPHLVSAKMSRRFQQKGWHKYSHVAVVIHYEDPINPKDHGVILLDPNFDIPVPLVFNEKNREISIDMGPKRGKWHFVYDGSMIICQSDEEKLSSVGGNVDQMEFYVTHSVADAYSFAFKPLIAADKTLSIVSRDKSGRHTAHLKLNLEKQTIVRSVDGNYLPIQAFDEFLKTPFDKTFCEKLRLPRDGLNAAVKKIILHLDTLAKLRKEFFNNTDVFGKI